MKQKKKTTLIKSLYKFTRLQLIIINLITFTSNDSSADTHKKQPNLNKNP